MHPGPTRIDSSGSEPKDPFSTPGVSSAALGAGAGYAGYSSARGAEPEMRQTGLAYQNVPSEQYWPESNQTVDHAEEAARAKRNRMWKIGGIIFAILAIIAIVVGVTVSQVTKKNTNNNASSSGGNSGSNEGNMNGTTGSASNFAKDSRLHQSFWGIAYTPQNAILPNCAVSLQNVTRDIQVGFRNGSQRKELIQAPVAIDHEVAIVRSEL